MLTHVRKRDVLLVRLEGELDQCSASGIRRDIDALLQDPSVRHLVLDMERMPFMDSSGIGVVLGAIIMVIGYTLGRAFVYSTPEYAIIKLPFEILQAGIGAVMGMVLCFSRNLAQRFEKICA